MKKVLLFSIKINKKKRYYPLIVEYVKPEAEISSNKFATYVSRTGRPHIEGLDFDHYYINHSLRFVDPIQPFIHTNGIERTWRSLKASISYSKRYISDDKIQSFLNCFQFHKYFSQDLLHDALLQMIVSLINL